MRQSLNSKKIVVNFEHQNKVKEANGHSHVKTIPPNKQSTVQGGFWMLLERDFISNATYPNILQVYLSHSRPVKTRGSQSPCVREHAHLLHFFL